MNRFNRQPMSLINTRLTLCKRSPSFLENHLIPETQKDKILKISAKEIMAKLPELKKN